MIVSIGHILAIAAAQYGNKIPLVCPKRSLSFTELDQLSNRCAKALVTLILGLGNRISLYSGNCWEWVVSYYGALKVGAVINPIQVPRVPFADAYRAHTE